MLYAAIRIRGPAGVPKSIEDTLFMLRLRQKHCCVLLQPTSQNLGMLKKAKSYIAYGPINKETLIELLKKRGKLIGDKKLSDDALVKHKLNIEKLADMLIKNEIKPKELIRYSIKPFFRLHPPRGGFKKSIKLEWPKGVLGNVGEYINELIKKML